MSDAPVRKERWDEETTDNTAPLLPPTEQPSLWRRWTNRVFHNGVFWLLLDQFLYTFTAFLYKVLEPTVPIFQIFVFRSIICIPLTWVAIKMTKLDSVLGPRELWPLLFARGLVGSLQMTLLLSSLYFLPLGDTTALFRTNPVFATLLAGVLRWETISALMVFGSLICVTGGVFVSHPPLLFGGHDEWGIDRMTGIGMALGAAVASAFSYLFIGRLGKRISPLQITFVFYSVHCVLSIPFVIAGFPEAFAWPLTPTEGALLLGVGLSTFCGQLMLTWGLQLCNASMGAAIGSSQMVLSYLAGYFFLREAFSLEAGIGILCIGMGITVVALGKERLNSKKDRGHNVEDDADGAGPSS